MGPGATVMAVVGRGAVDTGDGAAVVAGTARAVVVFAAVVVTDDAVAVALVDVVGPGRTSSASSDAPPQAATRIAIARSLRIQTLWWRCVTDGDRVIFSSDERCSA